MTSFNLREICPICGEPTSEFKRYKEKEYIDEMLKQKILKESPLCAKCKTYKK